MIAPYGGRLVNLVAESGDREALGARAASLPPIVLSDRALCDLELLATGAFSPLDRFMGLADYQRVLDDMRLASGRLFPVPVTLPVADDAPVALDREVALVSPRGDLLAVMRVEEIYPWSWERLAVAIAGTADRTHPFLAEAQGWGRLHVSGPLQVLALPGHHDFKPLRLTPAETRGRLAALGRANVVAFQTRNPLHRAHEELTRRAMEAAGATLLLHPVVGLTKPGDTDHYTRVRAYRALTDRYYDPGRVLLALLPLAMRLAGPREAVWHAIIRRNYGASHFIVGRDHAGPGLRADRTPYYEPLAAQELALSCAGEIGVQIMPFGEVAYLPDEDRYEEVDRLAPGTRVATLSGTDVRNGYLQQGRSLPAWFTRPEVAEVLAETYQPRHRQGVCVWFTGLSGSGKSTTAEVLTELLAEHGRRVTLLDGDVVRTHLSKGLGFSKEDRDTNIRRIGFVAAEVVRHGGVAVCAAVSPYAATRDDVRRMVGADRFVEVFVDTPIEVCERRDTKGMYARARRGEIRGFTGVDDPYEAPAAPDLSLDTCGASADGNASRIVDLLAERGFLKRAGSS